MHGYGWDLVAGLCSHGREPEGRVLPGTLVSGRRKESSFLRLEAVGGLGFDRGSISTLSQGFWGSHRAEHEASKHRMCKESRGLSWRAGQPPCWRLSPLLSPLLESEAGGACAGEASQVRQGMLELCLPACRFLPRPLRRLRILPTHRRRHQQARTPCRAVSRSPHSLFQDPSSWGGGRERVQTLTECWSPAWVCPAQRGRGRRGGPGSLWEEGPCSTAQRGEKAGIPLTWRMQPAPPLPTSLPPKR